MADLHVVMRAADAGIQTKVSVSSPRINVSVEGSGPPGSPGKQGEPGKSPEIRDGFWWTYNNETGQWENTGVEASGKYEIGSGLKLDDATNTLSVDTATDVEEDNTRPITSAAVYQTVGNIEILLGTI